MHDLIRSPDLMDMVAHLQLEVEVLKFVQSRPSTLDMKTLPVQSKLVAFTSTKVPKFSGVTSWDQYLMLCTVRHIECRPVGAGGKTGHAGRTSSGNTCDGISIVFHQRLPFGTLWTYVECGKVTRTQAPG